MKVELSGETLREVECFGRVLRVVQSTADVDFAPFWDKFSRGEWEPNTLAMIDAVVDRDVTFYDVGAWIGPTTLWAALKGGRIFSFEPDPVALAVLRRNLALNPCLSRQVTVVASATGRQNGVVELYSANLGNSETTVFNTVQRAGRMARLSNKITVPVIDLLAFVNNQSPQLGQSFMKMDIEGAEFGFLPDLLPLVAGYGIPLCVTLHPKNITSGDQEVILLLRASSICSVLIPYVDSCWSVYDGTGFIQLNKEHALKDILKNLSRDATLVFSKLPICPRP